MIQNTLFMTLITQFVQQMTQNNVQGGKSYALGEHLPRSAQDWRRLRDFWRPVSQIVRGEVIDTLLAHSSEAKVEHRGKGNLTESLKKD